MLQLPLLPPPTSVPPAASAVGKGVVGCKMLVSRHSAPHPTPPPRVGALGDLESPFVQLWRETLTKSLGLRFFLPVLTQPILGPDFFAERPGSRM